jgi:hypothetical protein
MKKTVRLTENDLTKIVKRVINEMDSASSVKVMAIVEGDMYMEFTIIEGSEVDGYINLTLKDSKGNTLRVSSPTKGTYIGGPIYDNRTNKMVYKKSRFENINQRNIMDIFNKNKIPFSMT